MEIKYDDLPTSAKIGIVGGWITFISLLLSFAFFLLGLAVGT